MTEVEECVMEERRNAKKECWQACERRKGRGSLEGHRAVCVCERDRVSGHSPLLRRLTRALLQWRAGTHVDVVYPDVTCGTAVKIPLHHHLPDQQKAGLEHAPHLPEHC